jgi:hypothetical protein
VHDATATDLVNHNKLVVRSWGAGHRTVQGGVRYKVMSDALNRTSKWRACQLRCCSDATMLLSFVSSFHYRRRWWWVVASVEE